jgi:hypothetical protein
MLSIDFWRLLYDGFVSRLLILLKIALTTLNFVIIVKCVYLDNDPYKVFVGKNIFTVKSLWKKNGFSTR